MTADMRGSARGEKPLEEQVKDLDRELRLLKRMNERSKPASFMPFGMQGFTMPPPPPPPPAMLSAAGPMMMAWFLSWLYSAGAANPMMLEQMARVASDRENFWHQAVEAFTSMADHASNGHAAVSGDDKKKIRAALEAEKFDPAVIDTVIHAMNMLDAMQSARDAANQGQK